MANLTATTQVMKIGMKHNVVVQKTKVIRREKDLKQIMEFLHLNSIATSCTLYFVTCNTNKKTSHSNDL
jgi:hypothetical protein